MSFWKFILRPFVSHWHEWGKWERVKIKRTLAFQNGSKVELPDEIQGRVCKTCGLQETRNY